MAWEGIMLDLVTLYRELYVECMSCGRHMIMDGEQIGRMPSYARRYFQFQVGDMICKNCVRRYKRWYRQAKAIVVVWVVILKNFEELI